MNKNIFKYKEIVNGELKYFFHPLNNIKKLSEKNKIINFVIQKMMSNLNSIEIVDDKNKENKLILEDTKNRKILTLLFKVAGKGGEKRKEFQKISLPNISFWKYNSKDIFAQSKMIISLYIPILNSNNENKYDFNNIIYLIVKDKDVLDRVDTQHNSSRWVYINDIFEVFKLQNQKPFFIWNKKKNVCIMNELQFTKEIKTFFQTYNIDEFKNFDSLLSSTKTQNILFETNNNELMQQNISYKVDQKLRYFFKQELLNNKENKCEFPQCNVNMIESLIASHIWAINKIIKVNFLTNKEKIKAIKDWNNGFLFCPNHDFLFDKYLISFDDKGRLLFSKKILKHLEDFNIDSTKILQIKLNEKNKQYLKQHRKYLKNN